MTGTRGPPPRTKKLPTLYKSGRWAQRFSPRSTSSCKRRAWLSVWDASSRTRSSSASGDNFAGATDLSLSMAVTPRCRAEWLTRRVFYLLHRTRSMLWTWPSTCGQSNPHIPVHLRPLQHEHLRKRQPPYLQVAPWQSMLGMPQRRSYLCEKQPGMCQERRGLRRSSIPFCRGHMEWHGGTQRC